VPTDRSSRAIRRWALLIVSVWAAAFAIRITGPSDLIDNDQARPAMYALDAVRNGHWIVQTDRGGEIASKPPLYTWSVSLVSLAIGRVNLWSLYLPCALAIVGTSLVITVLAGREFSPRAGGLGALAFLLSFYGFKFMALARTDALFTLFVSLGALAAWRAWNSGRGWTWFWLAAAAATLTKGPLGVVLGTGGLAASLWDRRGMGARPVSSDPPRPRALLGHLVGIALYLLIVGGWFFLAYCVAGDDLVAKLIGRELVGHALEGDTGDPPLVGFYKPFFYFATRYLPWSLIAVGAFVRVLYRPAADPRTRRFERFAFCWFWVGLLILSIAPHHRPDLLAPLIPPAAMLVGRGLARPIANWPLTWVRLATMAWIAAALIGEHHYFHRVKARDQVIEDTRRYALLAERLRARPDAPAGILDACAPPLLQYQFQTADRCVPYGDALAMLCAHRPEWIAFPEPAGFRQLAEDFAIPYRVIDAYETPTREASIIIVAAPR